MKNELEDQLRKQAIEASIAYYRHAHGQKKTFTPGDRIPYAGRVFDETEIINLIDSSLDFWLTTGRFAERFEQDFAGFLGVQHCSLTNSGSSANLLAFMSLTSPKLGERRIRPGDEVITVAAGFPTTVAPIIQYGAVPVFVDVSLPTYNIDVNQLDAALSERTKAVMVAHTLGNPFDLTAVKAFCDRHSLWLVEDNCDALGSRYLHNGVSKFTGTIGHIGTSSFYPPHHMTMGEGGAVYTDDPLLKRLVESFRDWGRDCWCPSGKDNTCSNRFGQQFGELPFGYDHKYVYSHFGYNLKVTDMQAAIGCAQLEKLPGFVEARKKNWDHLRAGLADLGEFFDFSLPTHATGWSPSGFTWDATGCRTDCSWFGFMLRVKPGSPFTHTQFGRHLDEKKIGNRMLFGGNLLRQPVFVQLKKDRPQSFRVATPLDGADAIMNTAIFLGTYPGLSKSMIDYEIETIHQFVRSR